MKRILITMCVFGCLVLGSTSVWAGIVECNGCSNQQALMKARQSGQIGTVFAMDFTQHQIRKYQVWEEYDAQFGQVLTLAVPQAVSAVEQDAFDDLDLVIDSLSAQYIDIAELDPNAINSVTGESFGVGFGAYDVIGYTVQGNAVLNVILDDNSAFYTLLSAIDHAADIFDYIPINYDLTVRIVFPDGSSGIVIVVDGIFVFDDDKFIDSQGNHIPSSVDSVNGQTYGFTSRYVDDYSNFVRRLNQLGIPITNGNSLNLSCTAVCGSGGCTTTCSRD